LVGDAPQERVADVAQQIEAACRDSGFFYVTGHGVPDALLARLDAASREFFRLPADDKMEIAMERGGRAWRGFFPVGAELTSGRPDRKEGVYFGAELLDEHPRVRAGVPLHGRNLFPRQVPQLRTAVLEYLDALVGVAQAVLRGVAVSLDLPADYFAARYTANPTILFRIFHYPPGGDGGWGVGEHTDYGLLTMLRQDATAGLQVRGRKGWIDAPPVAGSFVCNIGDMLERMTGGAYRSTPHRVRNTSDVGRLSFPFFFDPGWDAVVPVPEGAAGAVERWDGEDVLSWEGTYGEYLLGKVAKVFPALATRLRPPAAGR
jgi:isopenicillin N synthase-like dioxygenase